MRRLPHAAALVTIMVVVAAAGPAAAQEADGPVPPPPRIVPFEQWAPATCPTPTGADSAPIERVVVHHSYRPVATTPDEVLPALAEMCQLHVDRGFDTLGYHYVVDPWGTIYQGRGKLPDADGRAATSQPEGAHVQGSNPGAVGVVFLGDHQTTPPTAAAVDASVRLLAWLVEATGRDPGELVAIESTGGGTALQEGTVEVEVLTGHRTTNATLCPGEYLVALLDPIRDRVRAAIASPMGVLRATDTVRPAPDRVARVTSSGPILRAPPPESPLHSQGGLTGVQPATALLFAVLGAVGRLRRRST